eukprot:Skav215068  [mRNA]  locus=scaffold1303:452859:461538:- [translate_table: standard]
MLALTPIEGGHTDAACGAKGKPDHGRSMRSFSVRTVPSRPCGSNRLCDAASEELLSAASSEVSPVK